MGYYAIGIYLHDTSNVLELHMKKKYSTKYVGYKIYWAYLGIHVSLLSRMHRYVHTGKKIEIQQNLHTQLTEVVYWKKLGWLWTTDQSMQ